MRSYLASATLHLLMQWKVLQCACNCSGQSTVDCCASTSSCTTSTTR